jgi:hypothetical protein
MSNPLVHAFFVGRALAEALNEQLEYALTNALSELGKFDAEQRVRLRQFVEQIVERANREEASVMQNRPAAAPAYSNVQQGDLQATIDELRAEIAQLRVELQRYRAQSST